MDRVTPERGNGEVLVFKAANHRFSLPVSHVTEIIRPRGVTRVPLSPAALMGVTTLRGMVLPVISTASLMGLGASGMTAASRVIVVTVGGLFGLLVDEVLSLTGSADANQIDLDTLLTREFGSLTRQSGAGKTAVAGVDGGRDAREHEARHNTVALLAFALAGQEYALKLEEVTEVIALARHVAEVPHTDQAMLGVISFRGGLLPLVSIRVLLGLPAQGWDPNRARVIVAQIGAAKVGLVADSMNAIVRVDDDVIDPVPKLLMRGSGEARIDAICRLDGGQRLLSILSTARLFDDVTAARILADTEAGETLMPEGQAQIGRAEQFIVFTLGDEQYGIPIAAVDEIARRPNSLTRVPGAPDFIEGVMNLRGKVVPIIDQRQRFGSDGAGGHQGRIVIMTIQGLQAGFAVDAISEILPVAPEEMSAAPVLSADGDQMFDRVARVERDGRIILLIAPAALLDQAARDIVAAIARRSEAVPVS